ncbi:hypothetical protein HYFRA_00001033 [Hymenoscyphus fraxineus]|uniref:Rhodopsin domain-containing protein n=1 Tax=Hymenoscyphus fraxineus TaxID=746836 RepID=A0A9N9KUC0_9HELO|nr:hypothetical protein HYFRA_00001033 [Hymenoscyphus fraxineus]
MFKLNSTQEGLLAVSIVFPVLAVIAVSLRFGARKVRSTLQVDDWVILLAAVLCIGLGINAIAGVAENAYGRSRKELGPVKAVTLLKVNFADTFLTFAAQTAVKVSVLLFYKRIFITRKFSLCCNLAVFAVIAWGLAMCLTMLFNRNPISANWDPAASPSTTKILISRFLMSHAVLDLFLDIVILLFPLPVIRRLKMSTNRKIGVMGILWLGFFCVVASAVRIYYVYQFLNFDNKSRAASFGPVIANITIWSTIEPACSVIAACLPTFGPLSQKGRSPESLVASIRSALSLRSSSNSLATEKRGKVSQEKDSREDEEARAGWAKHNGAGSTTIESGAHSDVVPKRGEIIMEKSFSSE